MAKFEITILDKENTIVTYNNKSVSLVKCQDYFMGKTSSFWRVDDGMNTVSSLNRKKSEAISFAKKYLKRG